MGGDETPRATAQCATPPTATASSGAAREIPLDGAQRKMPAEALRGAEETRDVLDDALVALGRWLLVQVFDDVASAALSGRHQPPLLAKPLAGGPSRRLRERVLRVALHVAADDKRVNTEVGGDQASGHT